MRQRKLLDFMMIKGLLVRLHEDDKQTLGTLSIYDGVDQVFTCRTLELAWRDNQQFISCIPTGNYICKRRSSLKYGHHFLVSNVSDREFILIHHGNFHRDTNGCILVGKDHHDVNNDGYLDVTHSKETMKQLNNLIEGILFPLTVIDISRQFGMPQ